MKNLNKLTVAAGTLILTSSVIFVYIWLTRNKDKGNRKTKQNTYKNTVKEPVVTNILDQPDFDTEEEVKIDCRQVPKVYKSKYDSTGETTNLSRLERIIAGPCADLLRDVLTDNISPSDLLIKVNTYIKDHRLQGKKTQYNDVEDKLNRKGSYELFDITLLFFVFRNVCNIQEHSRGWGKEPLTHDRTLSANLDRIRSLKNTFKSHKPEIHIPDSEYDSKCDEILKIVSDLEKYLKKGTRYQDEVIKITMMSMDPEQSVHIKKYTERIKDGRVTWIERITSEELRNLFRSFNEDIPISHRSRSFICNLLKMDLLQELEAEIKSLSYGIVLTKEINHRKDAKPLKALVFEVDVDIKGEDFCFTEKDNQTCPFFEVNDDDQAKVILIRSNGISIVKTKLAVYRKYRNAIISKNIFLHHEYEEIDEIAKLVAYKRVSSYCNFLESAVNELKETFNRSTQRQHLPNITSSTRIATTGRTGGIFEIER